MRMHCIHIASLLISAALPSTLKAADPADGTGGGGEASEIIVMGLRVPTPIAEVGRSTSVIDRDAMTERQQRFLSDALAVVPGVQVIRSGSVGGLTSVSIRGLPSDQTLLVQDGIVVNNPAFFGNTFDFSTFDAADIERVELLRGAQSTLYGSDAIAGVVSVVTRDGREGFAADAFVEGGSFGTFRGAASVLGGSERASGRLTVSGVTSRGFSAADEADGAREDDGYRNLTVSTKLRTRPFDDLEIEAVGRLSDVANEFDGFPPPAFALGDTDDEGDARTLALAATATHYSFDRRVENRARFAYADNTTTNRAGGVVTFDAEGERISFEHQAIVRTSDRLTLAAGFEFERERAQTDSTGGPLSVSTTSGFALAQARPFAGVTVDAGVRIDNNAAFGSEATFSGSGSIKIPNTSLRIYGSYAEGFQAPTSGELQFNLAQAAAFAFDPSIDLTPRAERSRGFDVGTEWRSVDGRNLIQIAYFDQRIDDLLTFLFVPDAPNFGVFVNLESFETRGVEVSFASTIADDLRLEGAYAYIDATNLTLDVSAGNQPKHRANAQIAYEPTDRLILSAGVVYNGRERDGFTSLDPFTLVDLRAEWRASDRLAVFARIENAFDKRYQDNFGYGAARASWYAGVRTSL